MLILGNLLRAVAVVLKMGLDLYMWIIIARAILSWVSTDPYNPIVRFVYDVTEPALRAVRSKMPRIEGIDLSPIIIIFGIILLQSFVVQSLFDFAQMLK
ncbi:MAG: YggT family protein [Proteobacteria bacterium]|nr:YggT family protein [Pseudomonadota bacterium]